MQGNSVSPSPAQDLWVPASDLVAPGSYAALFWRPRFLNESTYLPHLPFTFWLAEVARPRRTVVLGLGDGVAHFALCQAGERLGAIDCWGIETLGPVPPALAEHAAAEYPEISRLIQSGAAPAAALFRERPVDLLVIARPLDAETLTAIEDGWLDRLSERGLLLVPDLDAQEASETGGALLDRLGGAGRRVRLDHGGGLLLAMIGDSQPEPLRRLAELNFGTPGHAEVRRVFARLGQGCVYEWASRGGRRQPAADRTEEIAGLRAECDRLRAECDRLRETAAAEARRAAAEIAGLRAEHDRAAAAAAALTAAVEAGVTWLAEANAAAGAGLSGDRP